MSKPRRIKITQIHPEDGFYAGRQRFIGQTGMFDVDTNPFQHFRGYFHGRFCPDDEDLANGYVYFLGVRYKKI